MKVVGKAALIKTNPRSLSLSLLTLLLLSLSSCLGIIMVSICTPGSHTQAF